MGAWLPKHSKPEIELEENSETCAVETHTQRIQINPYWGESKASQGMILSPKRLYHDYKSN